MNDEELMSVFIVAIVFAFGSLVVYLRYRTQQSRYNAEHLQSTLGDENLMLKSKTQQLESRIEVLESIVTDKNFRLKEEIRSLP
ncbi:MAG: hypothetical protein COA96_01465 [SAR86 cluster bacterium]|uniref:Uncharacterized protein n=1 Tax=SAR86 cluster bacterium TaxID=2030880 RepID=A0A2A5B9D5_9GAMM|nr:MAG: hypothetical protein COA96_01465 [SAR86 cluster bacterium]